MEVLFWIHLGGIGAIFAGLAWLGNRIGTTLKPIYPPRPAHHRQAV